MAACEVSGVLWKECVDSLLSAGQFLVGEGRVQVALSFLVCGVITEVTDGSLPDVTCICLLLILRGVFRSLWLSLLRSSCFVFKPGPQQSQSQTG